MAELGDQDVVTQAKRLLADPIKRIELDDFVSEHVRQFLVLTTLQAFPVQGAAPTKDDIATRVARYETLAADLQNILVLMAKWATVDQICVLEGAFIQLAESNKGDAGLTIWLSLGWYPALHLMYSAGIAALASKNYPALATVLTASVEVDVAQYPGRVRTIAAAVTDKISGSGDPFKLLLGSENKYAPRSEHLLEVLRPRLELLLHIGSRYESLFDKFEVLLALVHAETSASGWVPAGRFAWKHRHNLEGSPIARLVNEATQESDKWGPLQAGMFAGSIEKFAKAVKVVEEHVQKLGWF